MLTFRLNPSKKFPSTFNPYKIFNHYFWSLFLCQLLYLLMKLCKNVKNIVKISPKKNYNFLRKHKLNMNFQPPKI